MLRVPAIRTSVLASVLAVGLALLVGGCASHAAPAPEAAWRLDDAQEDAEAPEAGDWTAHRTYEYRGGRDPRTGRANIQM